MTRFDDHIQVAELLKRAQAAERDVRDLARKTRSFLDDPDGQWESEVSNKFRGRPKYTFDLCNDLVDDIAGEIEQSDFSVQVKPSGGEATKDVAMTYDGLIRNIEVLSNAQDIYNAAARSMVATGFDAWRIVQRWGDNDTFDQDLYIDPISDAIDRVWFDEASQLQTREDAEYAFVIQHVAKTKYDEKYPKGSGQSVNVDVSQTFFGTGNQDFVLVGEFLYKVKRKTRIVELSNGMVFKDDEKYKKVKDEYAEQGITEVRERVRELDVVFTRLFDAGGWLTEPQETVFDYIPIVPVYANFRITTNKVVFWGVISKKMDAQRVYNYAESRKVEEGALAPLEKIVATSEQIGAHADEWSALNTSADPVLQYEHQLGQAAPFKIGGASINEGLETVSQNAQRNLTSIANQNRLPGEPLGLRSGTAVELEQNKGDTRNFKYTASQEIAICHGGKILMRAIPKVYDAQRQVRILNEDASFEMVVLNEQKFDEESKTVITMNDLSQGLYDVTCDVGPAFKNRQDQTTKAIIAVAERDPTILELGRDVFLNNINSPGVDKIAERARRQMLIAGTIPEEQMTDDEKELLQSIEPEPDPVAEALQREIEDREDQTQLKAIAEARKDRELEAKIANDKRDDDRASMQEAFANIKVMAEALETQAKAYETLAKAAGIEGVASPNIVALLSEQASVIKDTQNEQP